MLFPGIELLETFRLEIMHKNIHNQITTHLSVPCDW